MCGSDIVHSDLNYLIYVQLYFSIITKGAKQRTLDLEVTIPCLNQQLFCVLNSHVCKATTREERDRWVGYLQSVLVRDLTGLCADPTCELISLLGIYRLPH